MYFKQLDKNFDAGLFNRMAFARPSKAVTGEVSLIEKSKTNLQLVATRAIDVPTSRIVGVNALLKRTFDVLFSLVAIFLLLPLYCVISVLIVLDSAGPVLFKQKRHGLNGEEIEIWKFRSMTVQENGADVQQAQRNDVRITRLGKYLRKTSLDELPQFFNVLAGSMSVVGPRPHAVAHNERYKDEITNYMRRHIVKPGITGWAQINGLRGETDTSEKMLRRVQYDFEYIKVWSLRFDFYIVLLTVFKGFYSENAY